MKLKCELISVEIDGKYMIYSSDRAVFGGMLRTESVWAKVLERLSDSFGAEDISGMLADYGFDAARAAEQAGAFTAMLARAGLIDMECTESAADVLPEGAELIMPEKDEASYSSMNTGCYYNSCCDCVEFNGWMDEDNEKPHISPLL